MRRKTIPMSGKQNRQNKKNIGTKSLEKLWDRNYFWDLIKLEVIAIIVSTIMIFLKFNA